MKLGLKFSPNFSWNRVEDPSDSISNKGVSLRTGGGAFLDFEFSDNYALHTGLTYTTKASGLKSADTSVKISLQYLEIPVAIKLFTNEIGTDMRMYFQVGGTINTNLAAKFDMEKSYQDADDNPVEYTKHISFLDFSASVSTGVEMKMGGETWVFGGLTYNRGLLNVNANNEYGVQTSGFQMYNEYLAIDLGLKF